MKKSQLEEVQRVKFHLLNIFRLKFDTFWCFGDNLSFTQTEKSPNMETAKCDNLDPVKLHN